MRNIMIVLAIIIGFAGQKALGTELEFNYTQEPVVYTEEQAAVDTTNEVEEMGYMTYNEMLAFDEMIHDLYIEEYCTNYCEDCDCYYYKYCVCNTPDEYCADCLDYETFISDNYDMIMDYYEEVLRGILDRRNNPKVEVKIGEF